VIFPFISGVLSFRLAPVTWSLLFLQLLVYAFSFHGTVENEHRLEKGFKDEVFTQVQGRLFGTYILENSERFPEASIELAKQVVLKHKKDKAVVLGNLAWRDPGFSGEVQRLIASEDPILSEWWLQKFEQVQMAKTSHPNYIFGIAGEGQGWVSWISYQFSHSGSMHLISNMIFLLIFGSALEVLIGGLGVLIVFLGAGAIAAGLFLMIEDPSGVPLIGASGAISGLMSLFAFLYWRKSIRYLFFLLVPKRGYLGFIYLPGWVILALWLLTDIAGYFGTPSVLGGVAYSAHLGGELAGLVVGFTMYVLRRYWLAMPMPARSAFIDEKPPFTLVR
jgi:membrane associated rhomboid family serine protease